MNFILNDRLGGSRCVVKSVLGENPSRFRHKERRWRKKISCDGWVGFAHTHCFFLSPCDSLVQVLRVALIAACTQGREASPRVSCLVFVCKLRSGVVGG